MNRLIRGSLRVVALGLLILASGCASRGPAKVSAGDASEWIVRGRPASYEPSDTVLKYWIKREAGLWILSDHLDPDASAVLLNMRSREIFLYGHYKGVGDDDFSELCSYGLIDFESNPACDTPFVRTSYDVPSTLVSIFATVPTALVGFTLLVPKSIDSELLAEAIAETNLITLAHAQSDQRWHQAYRREFAALYSSAAIEEFIRKYSGNDPYHLVPRARLKLAEARSREQRQRQAQETADRQARETARRNLFQSENIGRLVCKAGSMTFPGSRGPRAGQIQAFIEGFNPDGSRMRVRIHGYAFAQPLRLSSGFVMVPSEPPRMGNLVAQQGAVAWDEPLGWEICSSQ